MIQPEAGTATLGQVGADFEPLRASRCEKPSRSIAGEGSQGTSVPRVYQR